jgi:TonB family protein
MRKAWELPHLPRIDFGSGYYYPTGAMRLGVEGRVLVAFDITAAGRARNVSILWTEDASLATQTVKLLERARFKVSADWTSSGEWRRWRAGFVYRMPPSCQTEEFAIPVEKVYISASRLPGTAVRNHPGPNASGSCAPGK